MNALHWRGVSTRLAVVALALTTLAACSAGPREQVGAVLGGAAGGVAGAQIGQGTGQLAATAGGAGLGTLAGAAAGRSLDRAADTRRVAPREVRRRPVVRQLAQPVAEPTRQVPIPGADVPGSFWFWLPDFAPPAPMRNVQQAAVPASDPDCVPLDRQQLKPAYRCTTQGVTYVVQ
ncbi:hypothetical protein [Rhodovibrio salinarum]|uniref:Glycine zipper 2TM domain-containing protein n=1 Tax=Rhodovibrio salinarum TaxID=1087 RepID=A0A934QFQ5_9PROT|nr:hypothetical protein [Rhodovibrio salinarum]MBK1695705.1 hypothetical protein [Rhodovibrio salinarum]